MKRTLAFGVRPLYGTFCDHVVKARITTTRFGFGVLEVIRECRHVAAVQHEEIRQEFEVGGTCKI
jgi:hypothetical protein